MPFNSSILTDYSPKPNGHRASRGVTPLGHSPDIEFLAEQEVVVEVSDGTVDSVAVSHLHHGCPGLTLHELHLVGAHNTG